MTAPTRLIIAQGKETAPENLMLAAIALRLLPVFAVVTGRFGKD
jgi:hypothetical protein